MRPTKEKSIDPKLEQRLLTQGYVLTGEFTDVESELARGLDYEKIVAFDLVAKRLVLQDHTSPQRKYVLAIPHTGEPPFSNGIHTHLNRHQLRPYLEEQISERYERQAIRGVVIQDVVEEEFVGYDDPITRKQGLVASASLLDKAVGEVGIRITGHVFLRE